MRVIDARSLLFAGAIVLLLLAAAVVASPARSAVIHKPAGTFNIPEYPGSAPPYEVGIDEQAELLYVMGRFGGEIEKFDLDGTPVDFTGILGPNERQQVQLEGGWTDGDTLRLTCPNGEPTREIEFVSDSTALAAEVKGAVEAKCGGPVKVDQFLEIEFGGTLGHQDLALMGCAKLSGSGSCYISGGANGAPGTNQLNFRCGTCTQFAVDNSGGPNQGVIYVSSANQLTTEGVEHEFVPAPDGGIHAFLPSGVPTHSTYKGQPVEPHPSEFDPEHNLPVGLGIGGLYTRSQERLDVRACGVAVDGDGNLVIAHGGDDPEHAYFDKLGILPWASNDQQEGTLLGTINSDTPGGCRVQLDSSGNVYVMTLTGGDPSTGEGTIRKYAASDFHAASGTGPIPPELQDPSTIFHEGPDRAFAFDAEDHLYGLRPSGPPRVQQIDQTGSLTETFGAEEFIEPVDITVDKANGDIYVTDGTFEPAPDIHIYEAVTVPNSITEPFGLTTQTSGVLHGEVDLAEAGEEVTNCEFEYTTESLYVAQDFEGATTVPCDEGTTFTANGSVSTDVSGLTLEETYKFRLVTENANGRSNGNIRSFTPHAVVELETEAASGVGPVGATLNASFTGNGDGTEYFFEIGHGPAGVYTETTPTLPAGEPTGATTISGPVSNLQIETTYHYRVVAINGTGESKGFDRSFRTLPAVADLTTEPASGIDQESITLNAKFSGEGHDTKYYFEYGPTTGYGMVSGEDPADAGVTTGPTSISSEITTFYGTSTYHYRVVAENEYGTTYGKDVSFDTEAAPAPTVEGTEIDQLAPTSAHVSAIVAPNRRDASWLLEWGETTAYGSQTEDVPVLNGITIGSFPIAGTITGLEPATVYHVRVVAFNFNGVTHGPDITFRTPSAPKVEAIGPSAVTQTGAHLAARVFSYESPTDTHFEFGTTAEYGASTAVAAIAPGPLASEPAADLTGLTPGTTYHYRAVATNRYGSTAGPDETFTTLPAPPAPPTTKPPAPKKCAKGKVKRHGKCVPKHKRHKKKNRHHG
jgi:hypothetical protein